MSAAVRKVHYSQDAVYGNLAYDLDREIRERELRHAGEARRTVEAKPQPKARSVAHVQVRERQRVSVAAVLGFCVVAVLAVLVLMSYAQLTMLSSDVVQLKKELSALETQNVSLTAEYQQMYDLSTVKQAAEAAGMGKPGSSQIYYVDMSGGDNAVVYQQEEPGVLSRVLTSLNHGIYAVVEYFD